MDLAGAAAAFRHLAEEAEAGLALDCIHPAARAALVALQGETPVLSGTLRDSETIDTIGGSGTFAYAIIAPHTVYAEFRDRGGTIHVRNAKVLTDGVSFFGRSVTQAGSHYMSRGAAAGRGPVERACREVADRFFTL
jgi:hypothetical protein